MSSQVVSVAAGGLMAAALRAALNGGRVDLYAGATFVCTTTLATPCGTVVGGALALTVPTAGAITYVSAAVTLAVLFAGDGTRMFDLRARMVSAADDPDDPAAVIVQAAVLDVGTLVRVTSGTIAFA
jgi:hypothetical protein